MKNEILTLKDQDGVWIEGQQQVKGVLVDSLKEFFHSNQHIVYNDDLDMVFRELDLPQFSHEQISKLERPFSHGNIRSAMFAMDNSKSLGPDGFTAGFFKLHWDIVGRSVCDTNKSFLVTGYLLKEWNHSIMVMILKKDIPEEVSNLRLISLCNTIYKCASKCLVMRMKSFLPSIVSQSQHDFISGRFVKDNFLISHELIDKINRHRKGMGYLASVKIDMIKA